MTIKLNVVAEGDGDVPAVRVLVSRLVAEAHVPAVAVGRVLNANGRGNLDKVGGMERFYGLAAVDADGVLVVADADRDCAADHARAWAARIRALNGTIPQQSSSLIRPSRSGSWPTPDHSLVNG